MLMSPSETIIAQITPAGCGAVAMVRLSGPDAIAIAAALSLLPKNKTLVEQATHTIHYGWAVNQAKQPIDQVLFFLMRAPQTFTGEETVEISCHNNPFIIQAIIHEAIRLGARLAERGEFTRRAFENGKITLVQAEAINEIITTQTETALQKSLAQLEGSFSHWIDLIQRELMQALTLSEAGLEFVDDEVDFTPQICALGEGVAAEIARLQKTYDVRVQVRQGLRIALIGAVNAGKSSLFNRLLGQERSIVTALAGTTRDTVEAGLYRSGTYWTLIDTAGIRETANIIEQEGVRRSLQEAHMADIIVLVLDGSVPVSEELRLVYQNIHDQYGSKIIFVQTKIDSGDLCGPVLNIPCGEMLKISSTTGQGCDLLEKKIETTIRQLLERADAPFLINQRHFHILSSLLQKLASVQALLNQQVIHYELVSYHLRDALEELTQLTGKGVSDAALDAIFREFCVGK
jgi:tRNA modification GTPase